jgi:hypothetical protein
MTLIQKLRQIFMPTNYKEMFNAYLNFFSERGEKMKLERGGKVKVINKNGTSELFDSWEKLNEKYQLFPIENKKDVPFKIWTFGDPNRYKEIKTEMEKKYYEICGKSIKFDSIDFKKKNWVYFINSEGSFCQTCNDMVIDLLKSSSEWEEFKLPIKIFTKTDIAKIIGLDVDQFELK